MGRGLVLFRLVFLGFSWIIKTKAVFCFYASLRSLSLPSLGRRGLSLIQFGLRAKIEQKGPCCYFICVQIRKAFTSSVFLVSRFRWNLGEHKLALIYGSLLWGELDYVDSCHNFGKDPTFYPNIHENSFSHEWELFKPHETVPSELIPFIFKLLNPFFNSRVNKVSQIFWYGDHCCLHCLINEFDAVPDRGNLWPLFV